MISKVTDLPLDLTRCEFTWGNPAMENFCSRMVLVLNLFVSSLSPAVAGQSANGMRDLQQAEPPPGNSFKSV